MAGLPLPEPPFYKGSSPKRLKLHNDDCNNNDQLLLPDMPQFIIDSIAKNLDVRSSVHLQRSCRALYYKGFDAQRLISCHLNILCQIDLSGDDAELKLLFFDSANREINWSVEQFDATNFRCQADFLVYVFLTSDIIRSVTECLKGRGTIDRLLLYVEFPRDADASIFNRFLQQFSVSTLTCANLPLEFFELPGVKQLKSFKMGRAFFPLSLRYLLETDIHSCEIVLNPLGRRHRHDSEELHDILEKWTTKEKRIEFLVFEYFHWDEGSLFFGWKIFTEGKEMPAERPVVMLHAGAYPSFEKFDVIRADDARISLDHTGVDVTVRLEHDV